MTAYTATMAQAGVAAVQNHVGTTSVISTFALTAALAANDTITMMNIPINAIITDVAISTDTALDTNASSTIAYDVGDGSSANRFIAALAQGNNVALPITHMTKSTGLGYQYTTSGAENPLPQIIVTVHTGPATGATSGTLRVLVAYSMQALGGNPSSTAATDT